MDKLLNQLVSIDKSIIEMNQRLELWFRLEELSEEWEKIKEEIRCSNSE